MKSPKLTTALTILGLVCAFTAAESVFHSAPAFAKHKKGKGKKNKKHKKEAADANAAPADAQTPPAGGAAPDAGAGH